MWNLHRTIISCYLTWVAQKSSLNSVLLVADGCGCGVDACLWTELFIVGLYLCLCWWPGCACVDGQFVCVLMVRSLTRASERERVQISLRRPYRTRANAHNDRTSGPMHDNLKQSVSHQQQSPLMRHPHVHSAITKSHPPLHLLLKLVSLWIFKYSKSSGRWTSPCDLINKKDRQLQTTNGWALLSSLFYLFWW